VIVQCPLPASAASMIARTASASVTTPIGAPMERVTRAGSAGTSSLEGPGVKVLAVEGGLLMARCETVSSAASVSSMPRWFAYTSDATDECILSDSKASIIAACSATRPPSCAPSRNNSTPNRRRSAIVSIDAAQISQSPAGTPPARCAGYRGPNRSRGRGSARPRRCGTSRPASGRPRIDGS